MTFQEMFLRNPTLELGGGIVFSLAGIALILWGTWVMRPRALQTSLGSAWHQHRTLALRDLASENVDDEIVEFARQQWIRAQGWLLIGFGAGILLGVAASFAVLQAMVRVPFSLPWGVELLCVLPLFGGAVWGATLIGMAGDRRRRHGTLTSGNPSRRVSDYRSPLLTLMVGVPFLIYSIVTLIVAPQYMAFSPGEYRIVPPPRWILAAYPVALLLVVIFAEVCVWIVTKLPAPIRLEDGALAQRFNMGIIRQRMSTVYFLTFMSSAQLVQGGLLLFTPAIHLDGGPLWLGLGMLQYVYCFAVGASIQFTLGRMGGRLTGWLWSGGTGQNGTAAARGDGVV